MVGFQNMRGMSLIRTIHWPGVCNVTVVIETQLSRVATLIMISSLKLYNNVTTSGGILNTVDIIDTYRSLSDLGNRSEGKSF
jgi:hypothetical protein